jgi:2-desacetyl-2-hydroxyethyl bacteriochlorophyllide A dehydrogenase
MDALVFRGPGEMALEQRPRPQAGPGEAVIAITAAGICGSELTSFTGASTRRAPGLVFGHELAGVVRAVGPGASAEIVGHEVTINPLVACGRCATCRDGRPNACPNRTLLGLHMDGGFAEEVVAPVASLRDLGELDDRAGTLVEPMANAVHVADLLPGVIGREIAVLGAGPIGLSVLSALRVAGAGSVTVFDPVEARREEALQTGADAVGDPGDGGAESAFDHVVDAAGVTASRRAAIALCRPGGAVVLLGLHSAESELPINAAVAKELRLQCAYAYTQRDFDTALGLLAAGLIHYEGWLSERPLAEGQAAFETLVHRPGEATKIILRPAGRGG